MSAAAYIELHLKGGGRAIVEAGSIAGVIAAGQDSWKTGTPEKPTRVVIRGGETLDVIGDSPGMIIGRIVTARRVAKDAHYASGADVYVDWLEPMEARDDTGPRK